MTPPQYNVYLLLGSNLGDRQGYLRAAVSEIESRGMEVVAASGIYETAPWGVEQQGAYLNRVLQVRTFLYPFSLMKALQEIEERQGRNSKGDMMPRVLDIDILFFEDWQLHSDTLEIPHPRLHLRRFTLVPLLELAAHFRHPVLGRSILALMKDCSDTSEVIASGLE